MNPFENKIILITGASSGIGEALSVELYKQGASVAMAARNLDKMQAITRENNFDEKRFLLVETDVTKPQDCQRFIEKSIEKFQKIDVLINNAGVSMRANFLDCSFETLHQLMNVNFWGATYCTKFALPYIIKTKGNVVGVSSIAAVNGLPGRTGYSSSKFALHGLFEALRIENLTNKVNFLLVSPGWTSTNIRNNALIGNGSRQGSSPRNEKKMSTPQEIAKLIAKGILKRKKFIVQSSTGISMFWLKKFVPRLVDKLIHNNLKKEEGAPFN